MTPGRLPAAALLMLGLTLAGCLAPTFHPPPPTDKECIHYVCLANPNDHWPKTVLERYGWHQITDIPPSDAHGQTSVGHPEMEGDLIVWDTDSPHGNPGEPEEVVTGYNITTGRLVPIAVDPETIQWHPKVAKGKVAFFQTSTDPNATRLPIMVWDAHTNTTRQVNKDVPEPLNIFAFDGTWILARGSFGPRRDDQEVWAINIDTNQYLLVFRSPPPAQDGTRVILNDFKAAYQVFDGIAYYLVSTTDPWSAVGKNVTHTIYETRLQTNITRIVYVGSLGASNIQKWNHGLGFDAERLTWLYNSTTETAKPLFSRGSDYQGGGLKIRGDWAVWFQTVKGDRHPNSVLSGLNLKTGQTFQTPSISDYWQLGEFDFDEKRIVVAANNLENPNFGGIFWREFPPAPVKEA